MVGSMGGLIYSVMIDSFKDVLQPDDRIIHVYGHLWLVSCYHNWKNSMPLLFIAD